MRGVQDLIWVDSRILGKVVGNLDGVPGRRPGLNMFACGAGELGDPHRVGWGLSGKALSLGPRPQVAGLILDRLIGGRWVNAPAPLRDRVTVGGCCFGLRRRRGDDYETAGASIRL